MMMPKLRAVELGLIWAIACGLWSPPVTGAQPAPSVSAYPTLYRFDHGRWERSLLFEPGDRVRFVMPFLTAQPGWSFPRGSFRVQRKRVPFYLQPVIFDQSMDRQHGSRGYTIFSISFQMRGTRWLGQWIGEANVTNGQGLIGPTFFFTVLPHLARLFSVADAIALCGARSNLRQTIMVGGVWGEVKPFGSDHIARGWIATRWAGRAAIPQWWKHGVLQLTFPRGTNPGYPPPDGFLQVRSVLDCRTYTLTAVARPVF